MADCFRHVPRAAALLLLLIAANPVRAGAQGSGMLRGALHDAIGGLPVSGAVILSYDADGRETRSLSTAHGTFAVPAARLTRVRIVRLGFRPRELSAAEISSGTTTVLRVEMRRIALNLATVRVSATATCPSDGASGDAHDLWAQARHGLLASVVARETNPATVQLLMYERSLDARGRRVLRDTRRTMTGRASRPFRAPASAVSFRERGYMQVDASGMRTFGAPDADVLLDEAFAASHCFRIVAHPADAALIGLAFAPAAQRRNLVDVEGTLWLSRTQPELRTFDFRYTGVDRLSRAAGAGGSMTFANLANGVVLLDRWVIRLPVLAPAPAAGRARSGHPAAWGDAINQAIERGDLIIGQIVETGGLVARASWPDGARHATPLARVRGTVMREGTRRPMADAVVALAVPSLETRSDSAGRFALDVALPGEYVLTARDPAFPASVATGAPHVVAVAVDSEPDVAMYAPSNETMLRALCPVARETRGLPAVIGRIRLLDGTANTGLRASGAWQADYTIPRSPGAPLAIRQASQESEVDAEGFFHFCGVVRERPVSIAVERSGAALVDTVVMIGGEDFVRVNLTERPQRPVALSGRRADELSAATAGRMRRQRGPVPSRSSAVVRSPNAARAAPRPHTAPTTLPVPL